jgi:hypothetical protein
MLAEAPDPARPVHLYVCVADHFEPRWRRPSSTRSAAASPAGRRTTPRSPPPPRQLRPRPPAHALLPRWRSTAPSTSTPSFELVATRGSSTSRCTCTTTTTPPTTSARPSWTSPRSSTRSTGCLRRDPVTGQVPGPSSTATGRSTTRTPDGRFCGVDDELSVLLETGCYVDMTMPCVPSPAQGRVVNQIYYARSSPGRSRGHDRGREVRVGGAPGRAS